MEDISEGVKEVVDGKRIKKDLNKKTVSLSKKTKSRNLLVDSNDQDRVLAEVSNEIRDQTEEQLQE